MNTIWDYYFLTQDKSESNDVPHYFFVEEVLADCYNYSGYSCDHACDSFVAVPLNVLTVTDISLNKIIITGTRWPTEIVVKFMELSHPSYFFLYKLITLSIFSSI